LNYAVNRKAITRALFGDRAVPTSSPSPFSVGDTAKLRNYYPYDPAKAKALLAAAGYANGLTLKTLVSQSEAGNFKIYSLVQAICTTWAAVGVKCDLKTVTDADLGAEWTGKTYSVIEWIENNDHPWFWYQARMIPDGKGGFGAYGGDQHGWHDVTIDKIWLKAQRLPPSKATPLWTQLYTRAVSQAYTVPVVCPGLFVFVSKRVGGVKPSKVDDKMHMDGWFPTG
jgi:ABC-type transport system substrate-binding protein